MLYSRTDEQNEICRLRQKETETSDHVLCKCEALSRDRLIPLSKNFVPSLSTIEKFHCSTFLFQKFFFLDAANFVYKQICFIVFLETIIIKKEKNVRYFFWVKKFYERKHTTKTPKQE